LFLLLLLSTAWQIKTLLSTFVSVLATVCPPLFPGVFGLGARAGLPAVSLSCDDKVPSVVLAGFFLGILPVPASTLSPPQSLSLPRRLSSVCALDPWPESTAADTVFEVLAPFGCFLLDTSV
jgi:hypothetical protein